MPTVVAAVAVAAAAAVVEAGEAVVVVGAVVAGPSSPVDTMATRPLVGMVLCKKYRFYLAGLADWLQVVVVV